MAMMHQRMDFMSPQWPAAGPGFGGQAQSIGAGGTGVVREAYKDGTHGPVYFIRYNTHAGWNENNIGFPSTRTTDAD
jgi:hypothetical protein